MHKACFATREQGARKRRVYDWTKQDYMKWRADDEVMMGVL